MSKINYDEVPGCYLHCIKADCKMADHCLRQLAMQNLPSNLTAVTILNPQLTKSGEVCEYYRDDKPQVYGKGFKIHPAISSKLKMPLKPSATKS